MKLMDKNNKAVQDIFIESIQKISRSLSIFTYDNDNSITQGLFAISASIDKLSKSVDDLRKKSH